MFSEKIISLIQEQRSDNELPTYAFPGGYPVYYIDDAGYCLCQHCAQESKQDTTIIVEDYVINYEDDSLVCDSCESPIESAYGDPDQNQAEWEDLHMGDES
jgi:hypothetical protein